MMYLSNRNNESVNQDPKPKDVFRRLAAYQYHRNSLNVERSQMIDIKDQIDVNTGQELFKPIIN